MKKNEKIINVTKNAHNKAQEIAKYMASFAENSWIFENKDLQNFVKALDVHLTNILQELKAFFEAK